MARLVAKIVAMGLLIVSTYIVIWALPPRPDLVYSSLLDKHARLAESSSPRLIFVGGSGLALGLDSALIEAQVQRPVINMGINAGFGLRYMLAEVKPYIHADDIVVVVPEYEHFYGKLLEGDQNLLWALRIRPQSISDLQPTQIWQLLAEVPAFMQARVQEQLRRRTDPIYNRAAFNRYGDFVSHLQLPGQKPALYEINPGLNTNPAALTTLRQFTGEMAAKGASVVLIYPTVDSTFWHYHNNAALINRLHTLLTAQSELTVLGRPENYLLPTRMFFDTVYHLSSQGRALRSTQMANQIATLLHVPPTAVHSQ